MRISARLLNRDEMEHRRLQAANDLQAGYSQSQIARKFGVSRTTASRWQRAIDARGVDSLKKRRAPGRPSRLKPHQREGIIALFHENPLDHGYPSARWTTARLAEAIQKRFGVRYDPDHVGRLMHRLGLRQPVPQAMIATAAVAAPSAYAPSPVPFDIAAYVSRYSPNTDFNRAEISPTVA